MSYFQGGDFVELLSAQGKAPAAAWKLQGKISKTFDKGIKGNAFSLDGNAETKMQLPKTTSSSLGLAQRFVILQLLVPFTRSFSVEICFSDFQKVRRRFVVASAFRETARTALHVQLPLHVPRDQWMNLVFDLHALSELHFPDSGYRSMESICISGSCRLKRIFTMKDAPTPSQGSQVVKHADTRDIPRQFVFSATQRGASGATPIPTQYFAMEASNVGSICGVAATARSGTTTVHRTQTAPIKPAKGGRAVRPTTGADTATPSDTDVNSIRPSHQRLRTPARVDTAGSKLRRPQSKLGKVIVAQPHLKGNKHSSLELRVATSSDERAILKELCFEAPDSVSPVQMKNSFEVKKEKAMYTASPIQKEMRIGPLDRDISPPSSMQTSVKETSQARDLQSGEISLRESILGEIQQKITSLEVDDERADRRDRELFLRHTSLYSGEWHLQRLRDEDLNGDDAVLLSDDDDDNLQLSTSWRRELNEPIANTSDSPPDRTHHRSHDDEVKTILPRYNTNEESIFSFSSLVESNKPPVRKNTSRLFDFDSLLQDVKTLASLADKDQDNKEMTQLEKRIECALDDDEDDLELTKLLAAKRLSRNLAPQSSTGNQKADSNLLSTTTDEKEFEEKSVVGEVRDVKSSRDTGSNATKDRDDWVMIEKDPMEAKSDSLIAATRVEDQKEEEDDSDLDLGGDMTGLSIDLTSELSASGEHDHERDDTYEPPASLHTDEAKPKSDNDNSNSKDDAHDDDSSFDFEDLVEAAESTNVRDEDEGKHADNSSFQPIRLSSNNGSILESKQPIHEKRRGPPLPPRRMKPTASPLIKSPQRSQDRLSHRGSQERPVKSSRPIDLSSSFSSRRLQSLLESTDWTAELNAQATGLSGPPSSRSSSKPSIRQSTQKPPQTPSSSSIELVYDPILRCYYDPVSNKYYALAE